jgi:tetratricopeptide (TPR) repeat protein
MGAENVIRILRKNISAENLPCIISALRRDPLIWSALKDPILMGNLLKFSTGDRQFWKPANIAVLSVVDIAPEQFNLYPSEAWSSELQQNVKFAFTQASTGNIDIKDIRNVAFLALSLKNKHRENLNWRETLSSIIQPLNATKVSTLESLNPVIACLYGLVTDPQQLIQSLSKDFSDGKHLACHGVLSQPFNFQEQRTIFSNLLQTMPLDESLEQLKVLENSNCKKLTIELARSLFESSGLEEKETESDGMTIKQLNTQAALYQLAGEPKMAIQILNKAKSLIREMSKSITRSKGHIALYQLNDAEFNAEMKSEISDLGADEDKNIVATAAALIDQKQLTDDELQSLDPEIRIIYAVNSEKDNIRSKNIATEAVEKIINSGSFAINLVDPEKVLKALNSLEIENAIESVEDFFLKIYSDNLALVKTIRDLKLNRKDDYGAEEAAQLVAAINPDDFENRRILGNLNIQKKEWEEAYSEYLVVTENDPNTTIEDQVVLAEIASNTGRQKEAKQIAEKVIAVDERHTRAYICAGKVSLALGELNTAAKYLKKATELDPETDESWEGLAEYYRQIGDEARELETLKKGLQFSPDSGSMNYRMSQIFLNQGRFTETLPFLERAVKLIPGTSQIALDLARSLRKTGRIEDAASVIFKARQKWVNDPELAYEEGELNYFNKQLEEAVKCFQFAMSSLNPQTEWSWRYGKTLIEMEEQNDLDSVIDNSVLCKTYQTIKEETIDKEDLEKQFILAKMSFFLGKHSLALELYKKLNENHSAKSEFWQSRIQIGIGQAALADGKTEIALASLKEADARLGDDILGKKLLAEAYHRAGLEADAVAIAEEVPVILPARPAHYLWYARFMKNLGKNEESLRAYRDAVELIPDDVAVLLECANAESEVGNKEESLGILKRLLPCDLGSIELWEKGSRIADSIDEIQMAIAYLKKAIEKAGIDKVDQKVQLAILESKAGNISGAIHSINEAFVMQPCSKKLLEISSILHAEAGDFEQAIPTMKNSIATSEAKELGFSKIRIPESWKEMTASDHTKWFTLYKWAMSKGSLEEAYNFIENALSVAPDCAHYRKEAAYLSFILLKDEKLNMLLRIPESQVIQGYSENKLSDSEKKDYASLFALKAYKALNEGNLENSREDVKFGTGLNANDHLIKNIDCRIVAVDGNMELSRKACQNLDRENVFIPETLLYTENWVDSLVAAEKYLDSHQQEPIAWLNFVKVFVNESEIRQMRQALGIQVNLPDENILSQDRKAKVTSALKHLTQTSESDQIMNWNARFQLLSASSQQEVEDISLSRFIPHNCLAIALSYWRLGCNEDCNDICQTFPKDPDLNLLRSIALIKMDAEAAVKAGQWTIENAPDNVFSHIAFAKVCEKSGEVKTALQALEKALELRPDLFELHGEAAKLSLELGDSASALVHLEAAHQADPENEKIALALGDEYLKEKQVENTIFTLKNYANKAGSSPAIGISLANAYLANGNKELAMEQAEKIGAETPISVEAQMECSRVFLACGELQKAFDYARKAAMISPDLPGVIILIATIIAEKNSKKQALQLLEKAIEKGQSDYAILKTRALYSYEIDGEEKSQPFFEALNNSNQEDAEILSGLAIMNFHKGQNEKAKEFGLTALKFGAQSPQIDQILGSIYHSEGNLDKAVFHLTKSIQQQPDSLEVYLELSEVYKVRRDYQQAVDILFRATEHISDNPCLYIVLAGLLKDGKDYQQAEKMLRKAMELAPDDLSIRRQLGAVVALNLIHSSQEVQYAYEH